MSKLTQEMIAEGGGSQIQRELFEKLGGDGTRAAMMGFNIRKLEPFKKGWYNGATAMLEAVDLMLMGHMDDTKEKIDEVVEKYPHLKPFLVPLAMSLKEGKGEINIPKDFTEEQANQVKGLGQLMMLSARENNMIMHVREFLSAVILREGTKDGVVDLKGGEMPDFVKEVVGDIKHDGPLNA